MRIETFFEKFELLADTPNAVAKMRELVLQSAVHGQFSQQDKLDEPASFLVQQLQGAKARAVRNGRRIVTGCPTKLAGAPFCIPSHWAWVRLCDIGVIAGGHTPSKNNTKYWNGNVQWFTSKDIKTDELFESELKITKAAADSPGLQVYPPGCLFMVARSGILKRTFPVAVNRVPATANQDLKVLCPFIPGLERYLQVMFRGLTQFILSKLVKTGMTVQSLKYDEFATHPFPLPPLAEQKRIVAKVDELMALCDRLEAQLAERETRHGHLARASLARFADAPTSANLDYLFHKSYDITPADLRKTILTLAVQGKLVPQDPDDEPAEVLLNQIEKQKEELIRKKEIPKLSALPPVTEDAFPFVVPVGWRWIRLESVCEVITKGSSPNWQGVQYVDAENGVLFITSENVGNYVLRKMDEPKYVERKFNEMETRSILQRNDLLVNLVGASIGRSAIYDRDDVANINQAVGIIRLIRGGAAIDRWYLLHYLNSPTSLEMMFDEQVETARANLSLTNMKHFLVPIPPLAEQRRIVAKVDQLMALVDQLETQLAASHSAAEKLMEALVAELTAQ